MKYSDTTPQEAPSDPADILIGHGHIVREMAIKGPQEISVGDVYGRESATGRAVPLETAAHSKTITGDGATTAFDLDHDSVEPGRVEAWDDSGNLLAHTISHGTGTDGHDQIEFDVAPDGEIDVRYYRTAATPAAVAMVNGKVEDGEEHELPFVVGGSVDYERVSGLPDSAARGNHVGELRFV